MSIKPIITAAAAALLLAVPGAAAAKSTITHGKPAGSHAPSRAAGQAEDVTVLSPSDGVSETSPSPVEGDQPATPVKNGGKGYGRYCKGLSKQHVKGTKGTPFSRCVTAMAKAGAGSSPRAACKGLSKKHVKGAKGTPFSRCVTAAGKLKDDGAAGQDAAGDRSEADSADVSGDDDAATGDDVSADDSHDFGDDGDDGDDG